MSDHHLSFCKKNVTLLITVFCMQLSLAGLSFKFLHALDVLALNGFAFITTARAFAWREQTSINQKACHIRYEFSWIHVHYGIWGDVDSRSCCLRWRCVCRDFKAERIAFTRRRHQTHPMWCRVCTSQISQISLSRTTFAYFRYRCMQ